MSTAGVERAGDQQPWTPLGQEQQEELRVGAERWKGSRAESQGAKGRVLGEGSVTLNAAKMPVR